jgi:hypothetical protein
LGSIYSWLKITKDSTVNALIKDGEFMYSANSAKEWLKLLDRWNKYNVVNKI